MSRLLYRGPPDKAAEHITPAKRREARRAVLTLVYLIAVVLGLTWRAPALVAFGAGCLLLVYLPHYYAQSGHVTLTYRTTFSECYIWPGDQLRLTVEIENRSFLPISLLQVWDELPDELNVEGSIMLLDPRKRVLKHAFSLGMWQRVRRHYAISCQSRGVYAIGPTNVDLAGPLGYGRTIWQFDPQGQLLVYPRLHALKDLPCQPLAWLGESYLRSWLHEDPLRLRGVREYMPGDPLNRINWKATAKAARHMVHVYEPSAQISVQFLLNLANADHVWMGLNRDETEWAIEVTASIGFALFAAHCSVGVSANDYTTNLAVGAGEAHLQRFMEALARANTYARWKANVFIEHSLQQRHFGTTLVFVTPILTEEIMGALAQARISRTPLRVVYTGRAVSPFFDHSTMLWLPKEGAGREQ